MAELPVTDTTRVLALVREGRTRLFICGGCNRDVHTVRLTGKLPEKCEDCDPAAPAWKRERAERPLRATILALDERVRDLEEMLATVGGDASEGRVARCGPVGRQALQRAIRLVAYAKGSKDTADALLTLAAIAQAWAVQLTRKSTDVEAA